MNNIDFIIEKIQGGQNLKMKVTSIKIAITGIFPYLLRDDAHEVIDFWILKTLDIYITNVI